MARTVGILLKLRGVGAGPMNVGRVLKPKTAANLPRKLERRVGIAAIEKRSIKLRKDTHSK
jgi:hypothetical protein